MPRPEHFTTNVRPYADLPHGCRCGARWGGAGTCRCGTCHLTFTGVAPFDAHRRGGACLEPAAARLSLRQGRAYEAWGTTGTPEASDAES